MKTKLLGKLKRKFFYVYSEERARYHIYLDKKRYYTYNQKFALKAVREYLLDYARKHYKNELWK